MQAACLAPSSGGERNRTYDAVNNTSSWMVENGRQRRLTFFWSVISVGDEPVRVALA